jgi:hypothetical protein
MAAPSSSNGCSARRRALRVSESWRSQMEIEKRPHSESRPKGPTEPSPGPRPQADALGFRPEIPGALKGRESAPISPLPLGRGISDAPTGRGLLCVRKPRASAWRPQPCWAELYRPVGPKTCERMFFSRPFRTRLLDDPNSMLKHWAILECPSGTSCKLNAELRTKND